GPLSRLVVGHDMAAGYVIEQRAESGRERRRREWASEPFGCREAPGKQADRGALDIAFAAGDLAGEAQPLARLQLQRAVEQDGRIDVGVAVQAAEPRELGVAEPGNHAEDAGLLAMLQLGLEADHIVERAERIVLAQLHD